MTIVFARIKRKKMWDDNGVAATVGTILSLMVFLTFLGMFTNQYIPIWMKSNENNHMNQVVGQLSGLKSGIDLQILGANEMVASAPIYSPIQLHADGVPVFASPTMGQLSFVGDKPLGVPWASLSYGYVTSGQSHTLDSSSGARIGGSLEFFGPNRYFIQQTIIYENGAIILNQSNGEVVLAGISIRIAPSGSYNMVQITQTSLTGTDKTVGGFGTKSITTAIEYSTYTKVENASGTTLTLTMFSKYGTAWRDYYSALLTKSNLTSGWWVNKSAPVVLNGVNYYTITVAIKNVVSLEYTKAVASIAIGDIGV